MRKPTRFGAICGALVIALVYAEVRLYQLDVDAVDEFASGMVAHRVLADSAQVLLASLLVACGLLRIRRRQAITQSIAMSAAGLILATLFASVCITGHFRHSDLTEQFAHPIAGVAIEDRFAAIVEDPQAPMDVRASLARMHAESIYHYTGYRSPVVSPDGELMLYQPTQGNDRDEWIEAMSKFNEAKAYNTMRSMVALPVFAASLMFGLVAPTKNPGSRIAHRPE